MDRRGQHEERSADFISQLILRRRSLARFLRAPWSPPARFLSSPPFSPCSFVAALRHGRLGSFSFSCNKRNGESNASAFAWTRPTWSHCSSTLRRPHRKERKGERASERWELEVLRARRGTSAASAPSDLFRFHLLCFSILSPTTRLRDNKVPRLGKTSAAQAIIAAATTAAKRVQGEEKPLPPPSTSPTELIIFLPLLLHSASNKRFICRRRSTMFVEYMLQRCFRSGFRSS